jgi:hypothetical protein
MSVLFRIGGKKLKGEIYTLEYKQAIDFLLPKHYSGRKPQITKAYGWYFDGELKAVCTIGKPASASLCVGVCGAEYSKNVYELNRLCRVAGFTEQLSQFVSAILRRLKIENWIIVSYADSGMNHNGYIYQACNFLYTGKTKQRTDKYTEGNKHSRHYSNDSQNGLRKVRTAKHRYIYFCSKSKKEKKKMLKALNYPILEYPKEANTNYELGVYQEPIIIKG